MHYIIVAFSALVVFISLLPLPIQAENIDPMSQQSRYAWSENAGWLKADPQGNVTVYADRVEGYIWAENIGWINLSPTSYGGVENDGKGNLSGYAWSENAGWINLSCRTDNTCTEVDYGVSIDTRTGEFSGIAWGENIGWVTFDSTVLFNFHMVTSWRINGDVDSSGSTTLADAIITLQIVSGIDPASDVNSGADVDGNGNIGLQEAVYILSQGANL